jgi:hypothetical protein
MIPCPLKKPMSIKTTFGFYKHGGTIKRENISSN